MQLSFSRRLTSFGITQRERFFTAYGRQYRSKTLRHALLDIQAFSLADSGFHFICRHREAVSLSDRDQDLDYNFCGRIY